MKLLKELEKQKEKHDDFMAVLNDSVLGEYFHAALFALLDLSDMPEGDLVYEGDNYDDLVVHESLEKPTLLQMNEKFIELRDADIAKLQSMIDEGERKISLLERVNVLDDAKHAFHSTHNIPNYNLWLMNIIETDADSVITALEVKDAELKAARDAADDKEKQDKDDILLALANVANADAKKILTYLLERA